LLNQLLQSVNAFKGTAPQQPTTMRPATPSAQGLQALMNQMKAVQPQAKPIQMPNINKGVRQISDRPQGMKLRTPSMSPQMRQMMMGGKGAPV